MSEASENKIAWKKRIQKFGLFCEIEKRNELYFVWVGFVRILKSDETNTLRFVAFSEEEAITAAEEWFKRILSAILADPQWDMRKEFEK